MTANQDATFRLVIDTKSAEASLAGLAKAAEREATRTGKSLRASIGKGLGFIGLGGAIGAGAEAFRGATQSGVADVIGEALGPVGARIEEFFLGDLNNEARASRAAREEVTQQFAAIAGAQGWKEVPPDVRAYYNNIKTLRDQEEKGRELFRQSSELHGPGITEIVDRVMKGFGELLSDAVGKLGQMLLAPFR